jgi:hypothetical protein
MMTVKQLIAKLYELNQDDAIVILSADAEGNTFSPASSATTGHYLPNGTYSGECVDEEYPDAVPAIFLYPTN